MLRSTRTGPAAACITLMVWVVTTACRSSPTCECRVMTLGGAQAILSSTGNMFLGLDNDLLTTQFGQDWRTQHLYYASDRAVSLHDGPVMVKRPRLQELARGVPVLVIHGTEWDELYVRLYSADRDLMCVLRCDLRTPSLEVHQSARGWGRSVTAYPDGTLDVWGPAANDAK